MPDSVQKKIKYREGDAVVHDDHGTGIVQEYDPEQEYVRVQFPNDNLIDLHISEVKQTNTPLLVDAKSNKNNESGERNEDQQNLDEAIIFTLKSIDSRRCKIDNIYKKVLLFCALKIRGKNRKKYYAHIEKEISKLIKKKVITKYITQHGIWIKLEDIYVNYLKKKNKEKDKNSQQLSLFEAKQFPENKNQELQYNGEDNDSNIEDEEGFGNFSIPDPDDLIKPDPKIDATDYDSNTQPSKLETMLGLNQSQTRNEEDGDIDLKIDSIICRLNSVKGIFASKEINTINIELNENEVFYIITGKIDRLNDSMEFMSYLDYDESILSRVLSVSGGHHFSSIIGIQLKNGTQVYMTIRKTIYNFTPIDVSFELLVNMIDDLRQIISIWREKI